MKCAKQGHFRAVCKSKGKPKKTDITEVTKDDPINVDTITSKDAGTFTITQNTEPGLALGEAAGLLYCMGKIDREVSSIASTCYMSN